MKRRFKVVGVVALALLAIAYIFMLARDLIFHHQVIGTWSQGPNHTLTLASDGSYTSFFTGWPDHHTITFQGKWAVRRGYLVWTEVRSNSIPVPDASAKILGFVHAHRLYLGTKGYEDQPVSFTR